MSPAEAAAKEQTSQSGAKPHKMASFQWEDPLLLDEQLSEETR